MILSLLFVTFAFSNELGSSSNIGATRPRLRPPGLATQQKICVRGDKATYNHARHKPSEEELSRWKNSNKKTNPHPRYNEYMRSLRNVSASELAARLAYTEIKEAGCEEHIGTIRPYVVETILNRMETRKAALFPGETRSVHELNNQDKKKLAESVIFQYQQFASSLHRYKKTKSGVMNEGYKLFLCPPQDELFNQINDEIGEFFSSGQRTRNHPSDTYNYYLYAHAPEVFVNPPDWANENSSKYLPEVTSGTSSSLRRCFRAFRESRYK